MVLHRLNMLENVIVDRRLLSNNISGCLTGKLSPFEKANFVYVD